MLYTKNAVDMIKISINRRNLKTNTVTRAIFIYQEQPVITVCLFKMGIDNGQNLRLCLDIRSHLFSFYS